MEIADTAILWCLWNRLYYFPSRRSNLICDRRCTVSKLNDTVEIFNTVIYIYRYRYIYIPVGSNPSRVCIVALVSINVLYIVICNVNCEQLRHLFYPAIKNVSEHIYLHQSKAHPFYFSIYMYKVHENKLIWGRQTSCIWYYLEHFSLRLCSCYVSVACYCPHRSYVAVYGQCCEPKIWSSATYSRLRLIHPHRNTIFLYELREPFNIGSP